MPGGSLISRGSYDGHPRVCSIAIAVSLLLSGLLLGPMPPGVVAEEPPPPYPENELMYPGFERAWAEPGIGLRPVPWHPGPMRPVGVEMSQVSEQHHNGSHSAWIHNPPGSLYEEVYWYQDQTIVGGEELPLGGWVRMAPPQPPACPGPGRRSQGLVQMHPLRGGRGMVR
jgi:hypothetical protein